MRLMGLDVGTKRIGVALSDEEGRYAFPLTTLESTTLKQDLQEIAALTQKHGVQKIVIGLPKTLSGERGIQACKAERFAQKVQQYTGLPVETWDERFTTLEAEKVLIQADVRRRKRKKVVDKLAAVLLLETFIRHFENKRSLDERGL